MSPRGFGAILGSIISGRILANPKIDGRVWIGGGFAVLALSMYMFGDLTIQIAPRQHHLADHHQRFCGDLYLRSNDDIFDGNGVA